MLVKHKHILLSGFVMASLLFLAGQSSAAQKPYVDSAIFTTAIKERRPVDQVLLLTNKTEKIFFHTDLRNLENQKIIHRWEYNGKVISSRIFNVNGPLWRVYSRMTLSPEQLGTWRVVVTTDKGWPLKAAIFKYIDNKTGSNAILPLGR